MYFLGLKYAEGKIYIYYAFKNIFIYLKYISQICKKYIG